ncbi:MAG: hypothetical protein WB608_01375 [Terracidiphilus sp.]
MEVELSKTQSWIEAADIDLYGRNGDLGVIREHRDDRADRRAHDKFIKQMVGACGLFAAVPAIIEILKAFNLLPK